MRPPPASAACHLQWDKVTAHDQARARMIDEVIKANEHTLTGALEPATHDAWH